MDGASFLVHGEHKQVDGKVNIDYCSQKRFSFGYIDKKKETNYE